MLRFLCNFQSTRENGIAISATARTNGFRVSDECRSSLILRSISGLLLFVLASSVGLAQVVLPKDVQPTCTVSPAEFSSWFVGGKVVPRGIVLPADSVAFPTDNTDCDFYKWSWQMFLWVNSPIYTGSGREHVLDGDSFFDVSAPSANGDRRLLSNSQSNPLLVRNRKPVKKQAKLDSTSIDTTETGQAGGSGTLMAQSGSLLYYGIHVNNVYAYFLAGQKGGKLTQTTFPTTEADLADVNAFAGTQLPSGVALAMELKTSWVQADSLSKIGLDPKQYVIVPGTIPLYDQSSTTTWKPTGSTVTIPMALIGMHVVGTVQGHPEMVWASFEHVNNAPNAQYQYINNQGNVATVPPDSNGNWLLMSKGGDISKANQNNMITNSDGSIVAGSGQTISPGDTARLQPWGNSGDDTKDNTDVISLNQSVLSQLPANDVRRNYLLIGALWTQHGDIPPAGTQVGSKGLANSTMETYHQNKNCFACHKGTSFGADDLSHIYANILPQIPQAPK